MENVGKKVSSFAKEVMARLSGEQDEVIAQKVSRKAMSAIEGQLAALRGSLIDDEQSVEDAEEAFKVAVYPTAVFSDNKKYCKGIVEAQARLEDAKENLEQTKESIKFFEKLVKDLF